MKDDMHKFKDAYLSEANSYVKEMNRTLLLWEKHPKNKKCLQDIFRIAHTLKSISAAMGYQQIAQLSHAIEDYLEAIRDKKIALNDNINLLFNCLDFLIAALKLVSHDKPEPESQQLIDKINRLLTTDKKQPDELTAAEIPTADILTTIEVKVERLDKLLNLTKELLVKKMTLETLSEALQDAELTTTVDIISRTLGELQYQVMQIRLVPIGYVFQRFIRMVRDISKRQKKDVELKIEGENIELDRSLIDGISEPIVHLVKNAIDHGLEPTQKRIKAKKTPTGEITLAARREKDSLIIKISDDGAGLDLDAIKKKALERHLLGPTATDEEIANSIFAEISTSKEVTDISGRGLGLSIVKQSIESMNGKIRVATKKGLGTTFIIKIPLTLAVIFVLLVKHANHTYAIPLTSVQRLVTVDQHDIKGLINNEAIIHNNTNIPVVHLSKLFNIPESKKIDRQPIVVLQKEERQLGLIVDELLITEEIITQPINIKGSKLFSGTALLGSGETILILDVEQLFLQAQQKKETWT